MSALGFAFISLLAGAQALVMAPAVRMAVAPARSPVPVAMDMPNIYQMSSLLAEIVDGDGERAYG